MQRVKELDSLRGLSALAIVFFHLPWIQVGLLGTPIYLFFVLSGYLITSIILSHPPSGGFLFAFYLRRGLRIWPIYYLSLLLLVAINRWTPSPASLDNLPHYLTFTQLGSYYWSNTVPAPIPAFEHTWTLAVEEQFYLIWPALLLLLRRRGVSVAAIAVIALAVAMRILGFNGWLLATNCDGLALGALLAGLLHGRSQSEARVLYATRFWVVGLGAALCVAGSLAFRLVPGSGFGGIAPALAAARPLALNLFYFALVALTVLYAGDRRLAVLRDRRLVYLGEISYGLYLYHYMIFVLWHDYAAQHGLESSVVYDLAKVGASVVAAALSYRFVERPLLSIKDLVPYPAAGSREVRFPRRLIPLTGPQKS